MAPTGRPRSAAAVGSPRRSANQVLIVALVLLSVLVVVLAGLLLELRVGDDATEIVREPLASAGANPFMPAVGTGLLDVNPVAAGGTRSGDTPGLYGGSGDDAVCDRTELVRYLADRPDKAVGWAGVFGLQAGDVASFVAGLTPVVLRADTVVTNHGWAGGTVTSYGAVLQAGTAVLVDAYGRPVTRCSCGNPLTEPASYDAVSYVGPTWSRFSASTVTVVQEAPEPVERHTLVDVRTGEGRERPVGTAGSADELVPAESFPPGLPGSSESATSTVPNPSSTSPPSSPPATSDPSEGGSDPCSSPAALEAWARVLDPDLLDGEPYTGVATPESNSNPELAFRCVEGHAIAGLVPDDGTETVVVIRPVEGYWDIATSPAGEACGPSDYPSAVRAEVCRESPEPALRSSGRADLWNSWQELNDTCRGGSGDDPSVLQACVDRDRVMREHFDATIVEFLDAWQREDAAAMQALTHPDNEQDARTIPTDLLPFTPAESTFGDCRYDVEYSGGASCYMSVVEGGPDLYLQWESTYYSGWLVRSFAPDV